MTLDQLKEILHHLHLDFDATPTLLYVFYQTDDGLINNFSISVRHARQRNRKPLTEQQLLEIMESEYPATRRARLLAVEHPKQGLSQWLDTVEVCERLHTSPRSLGRWVKRGLLHPSHLGNRNFYSADEVERLLQSNIIQENGRLDLGG